MKRILFYKKALCIGFVAGIFLTGCGSNSSSVNDDNKLINKKSYLKIAKLGYMNENSRIVKAKDDSKAKIPAENRKKLYPGDSKTVLKHDNQLEISSDLSVDKSIKNLYIENDTSKISINIDKNSVEISLYQNSSLVEKKELTVDEFFTDPTTDKYFQEGES